jgi:hypothetical protein
VRGITHQQNLEPYLGDMVERELSNFAKEVDAYKEKSQR